MTRRSKRQLRGIHTKAVKAWLRERTLVMMQVRRERRARYKVRKAYERELLAQEKADVQG